MRSAARTAMLTACAALASPVAGCGGDSGAGRDDPLFRTLERSAKADDEVGARFVLRGRMTAFGKTFGTRGYGQFEPGRKRGRIVVIAGGDRDESFVDGPFVIHGPLPFEEAVLDDVPENADWRRVDRREVTGAARGGPTAVVGVGPTQSLELLVRAGADVQGAGRERVRGVPTRRYRVTLPFGRYLDAAVGRLDDPLDCPDAIRDATLRLVLWIDDDDRLRRTRLRLASAQLSVAVTIDITRYERGLSVRLPADRSIFDATDDLAKLAAEDTAEQELSGEC